MRWPSVRTLLPEAPPLPRTSHFYELFAPICKPMKLVAFDGDDTLWTPLDGIWLSDRSPDDRDGWPHFAFEPVPGEPLVVSRSDNIRFSLRPEARDVLQELKRRGVLTGIISYNHRANVVAILEAFGVLPLVNYVVARWHTDKGQMLGEMLEMAKQDDHAVGYSEALLVDDDPRGLYALQFARLGAGFIRFGVDIKDLREVLPLLDKRGL